MKVIKEFCSGLFVVIVSILILSKSCSGDSNTLATPVVKTQPSECNLSGKVNAAVCYLKNEGYYESRCEAFYAEYNNSVSVNCLSQYSNGMSFNLFDNGQVKVQRWSGGKLAKQYYIDNWK